MKKIFNNFSCSLLIFVIFDVVLGSPPQCGLYGMPPCSFLPAPPGTTPSCAGPGKTYCEHVPHYPAHVIKHLVQKWGYDFNTLLTDETVEDFNSYRNPNVQQFYGPPQPYGPPPTNQIYTSNDGYKYGPPNNFNQKSNQNYGGYNEEYPEPIYIPRPNTNNNAGYHNRGPSNGYQYPKRGYNYYNNNQPSATPYSQANNFKRYVRELAGKHNLQTIVVRHTERSKRSIPDDYVKKVQEQNVKNLFIERISSEDNDDVKTRKKRQSPGRSSLCQTSSSFIQPQAALSSKGNWMYVVNQVETVKTQLVKTETCASSVCSNLCQLPNGYNSRCEQKYVQKRLVALEGNGQRLYTDTFWFPSCCVCTLSTN